MAIYTAQYHGGATIYAHHHLPVPHPFTYTEIIFSHTPAITMSSESLTVMATAPSRLLNLPAEVVIEIFHQVAFCSNNSADLLSLATSSKRLYAIFRENELAIIRHATTHFLAVTKWPQKPDPLLADFVVKIGILRHIKPWPVDLAEIKTVLAQAQDTRVVPSVDRALHGKIMAWVRAEIGGQPGRRCVQDKLLLRAAVEDRLVDSRRRFNVKNHLWENHPLQRPVVWHPFDWIDPEEILHTRNKEGRHRFYCYRLSQGLAGYEAHAKFAVSNRERALFGRRGYVPCCKCVDCPRFQ